MELFLTANDLESFLLDLLTAYLMLDLNDKVKIVRLSKVYQL
jgi:hypothetical protein